MKNCQHAALKQPLAVRPKELLCACCMHGCGGVSCGCVSETAEKIAADPIQPITLATAFDFAGAKTDLYDELPLCERRADLEVLRLLGSSPGDTRTALVWYDTISKAGIAPSEAICGNCELRGGGRFSAGLSGIVAYRPACELKAAKEHSVSQISTEDALTLRIHHFLCMTCHAGSEKCDEILEEDNLKEVWDKIAECPDIPVTLTDGPEACEICPPCFGYDPKTGLCILGCSLKDRKKDLDVFAMTGLAPGMTLPARAIYKRIFDNVKSPKGICFYERTAPEWSGCPTHPEGTYENGVLRGRRDILKETPEQ